ncbi:uncharacterized protein LOC122805777 [Protopterus annectens]|uniref:uncharacterized protein LOC122805777 n=1 Tax=Protopterus annectens TaxID=7888 RepID=UPI001CFA5F53|nr:uncharacterized protein LOC122805777 [Protopterus annectens]
MRIYISRTVFTPDIEPADQEGPTVLLPCYFSVESGTVDLNHLTVRWEFQGNRAAMYTDNILFNTEKAQLSLEELRKGNASLVLTNASPVDAGDYSCDISYKSDTKPRVTISLTTQDVSPPSITPGFQVGDQEGPTVLLPCYFSVESGTVDLNHLTVRWEFQGNRAANYTDNILFNSERAQLSLEELKKGNASLVVINASPADAGDYTCDISYKSESKPKLTVILSIQDVAPSKTTPDTNVTTQQEKVMLLPCYFTVESGLVDLNHLVVQWEFNGKHLAKFSNNIMLDSKHAKLSVDELKKGNASLVLTDVSSADAGYYTCDVKYLSDNKPRVSITLRENDVSPPNVTTGSQEKDQQRPTVLLPCYFSVNSGTADLDHLTVRWEFHGNHVAKYTDNVLFNSRRAQLSVEELRKGNASLVVINASPADAGDYTCDISYKSDNKPRVTVILNIQDAVPTKPTPDTNVTTQQTHAVLLPCYFTVESGSVDLNHLVVQWEFNGKHLARFTNNVMFGNKRAWLPVDELQNGNASLVLTEVSSADAGDYTCDVSYKSDTQPRVNISLSKNDVAPPTTTPGSQGADYQGPTVVLPCYFSVDSGTVDLHHLEVLWQFKENRVARFADNSLFSSRRAWLSVDELRKGNASLVLTNVSPGDEGDYTCDVKYFSDTKPRVTLSLHTEDIASSTITPDSQGADYQGPTVVLPCYFSVDSGTLDLRHLVVLWQSKEKEVAKFADNILINSRRARLSVDELRKGNASLVLANVSPADAGDYTCDVQYLSDTKPRVTVSLNAEDVAPPTTTPGSQGADYQGTTVVLPCYFSVDTGIIQLHHLVVLWQFKEKRMALFTDVSLFNSRRAWLSVDELRKGNASLVLTNVSPADAGDYTCDVKYLSDTKPRVTVSLNSEDIAPPTTTPDSQGADYQGPTVVLPCYFSVDSGTVDLHHLVVLWQSKEKQVAKFADNILFNSTSSWLSVDELRKGNASLVLTNVSTADAGDYTCDVKYLSDTKPRVTVSLNAEDVAPPATTPGSQGPDYQGPTVVLPCYFNVDAETVDLHHLFVLWQSNEKQVASFADNILFNSRRAWLSVDELSKGNASLVLTSVLPADAEDYTCDVQYMSDIKPRVIVSLNSEGKGIQALQKGRVISLILTPEASRHYKGRVISLILTPEASRHYKGRVISLILTPEASRHYKGCVISLILTPEASRHYKGRVISLILTPEASRHYKGRVISLILTPEASRHYKGRVISLILTPEASRHYKGRVISLILTPEASRHYKGLVISLILTPEASRHYKGRVISLILTPEASKHYKGRVISLILTPEASRHYKGRVISLILTPEASRHYKGRVISLILTPEASRHYKGRVISLILTPEASRHYKGRVISLILTPEASRHYKCRVIGLILTPEASRHYKGRVISLILTPEASRHYKGRVISLILTPEASRHYKGHVISLILTPEASRHYKGRVISLILTPEASRHYKGRVISLILTPEASRHYKGHVISLILTPEASRHYKGHVISLILTPEASRHYKGRVISLILTPEASRHYKGHVISLILTPEASRHYKGRVISLILTPEASRHYKGHVISLILTPEASRHYKGRVISLILTPEASRHYKGRVISLILTPEASRHYKGRVISLILTPEASRHYKGRVISLILTPEASRHYKGRVISLILTPEASRHYKGLVISLILTPEASRHYKGRVISLILTPEASRHYKGHVISLILTPEASRHYKGRVISLILTPEASRHYKGRVISLILTPEASRHYKGRVISLILTPEASRHYKGRVISLILTPEASRHYKGRVISLILTPEASRHYKGLVISLILTPEASRHYKGRVISLILTPEASKHYKGRVISLILTPEASRHYKGRVISLILTPEASRHYKGRVISLILTPEASRHYKGHVISLILTPEASRHYKGRVISLILTQRHPGITRVVLLV